MRRHQRLAAGIACDWRATPIALSTYSWRPSHLKRMTHSNTTHSDAKPRLRAQLSNRLQGIDSVAAVSRPIPGDRDVMAIEPPGIPSRLSCHRDSFVAPYFYR